MIFVLDTTIGLAVWLPFTIGKTTALLMVCRYLALFRFISLNISQLEPIRILHLLHWPISVIRYATDPLVDLFTLTLLRGLYPVMKKLPTSHSDLSEATDSESMLGTDKLPKVLKLPLSNYTSETL